MIEEERGSAYSINKDTVFIQNAWGVAEIQKVYTIFKSVEVLNLIDFVDKNPLGSLRGMKYMDLMKEIQEKFENTFKNIDLKSAIDWQKIPTQWAEKELVIVHGSWVIKSLKIGTAILHKRDVFSRES